MIKNILLLGVFSLLTPIFLSSQPTADQYIQDKKLSILTEYVEFLKLPNTMNDRSMLDQNADLIMDMMNKAGISNVKKLDGETPETIPSVYGEVITPGATQTILFYAHYDGQPVNPDKWAEGLSPFVPQLTTDRLDKGGKFVALPNQGDQIDNNWRLYARASADDKAGVFAIIKAYEFIHQSKQLPKINIKFFFEGEEEKGSTNLASILKKHKSLLGGDIWVICDGPIHMSGQKTVSFGVRGDINLHLTIYGPARPLHSGNYGNWAPNPANKLVKLLSSMKNDAGLVTIKGFYDDVIPLSAAEKLAIKEIPPVAEEMRKELLFAQVEVPSVSYYEAISAMPTLNINGIVSANVGRLASNIIPTSASATLDLRLVKGNDKDRQIAKVINYIKSKGYFVTDKEPTDQERLKYAHIAFVRAGDGYNAQRTNMSHPVAKQVVDAIKQTFGKSPILIPSSGGSLPLFIFEQELGTSPITIPIVNYDNNQHGENENLKIGYLFEGIKTMVCVMMMKSK
jgi:acetylornithine deacetylase/succinyl-diaminopimelate desuccinylase-like protein